MTFIMRAARLFSRGTADGEDVVQTSERFEASPEAVWQALMFYEEIPHRPSLVLRALLPMPLRTRGTKTTVGALVECTYDRGRLEKEITSVEPARHVQFLVRSQSLGIEDCIEMTGGSYALRPEGDGCALELTTRYHGRLRPRWLFRRVERFVARRVHRHILVGMRAALEIVTGRDVVSAGA